MKKYRVFRKDLGWCECLYIFDKKISFKEIISNQSTSYLTKNDYIGLYEFDSKFLNIFKQEIINGKKYFIRNFS